MRKRIFTRAVPSVLARVLGLRSLNPLPQPKELRRRELRRDTTVGKNDTEIEYFDYVVRMRTPSRLSPPEYWSGASRKVYRGATSGFQNWPSFRARSCPAAGTGRDGTGEKQTERPRKLEKTTKRRDERISLFLILDS